MTPTPTVSNIMQQLGAFVSAVLPSDVVITQGQPNRVAEPAALRFAIMSPPRFERLETNVDTATDANFTGSVAGTTMTITAVDSRFPNGKIGVGSVVFGPNLQPNTTVTAVLTGTGQVGTYAVTPSQTAASGAVSAGTTTKQMNVKVTVAIDFHAADGSSGDLANTVSTLMRDPFAIDQFANQQPNFGVVPLHADDAVQRPFFNDQQQVEWRWVVEALLQANIVVTVPQQFADSVALDLESVFADFPT